MRFDLAIRSPAHSHSTVMEQRRHNRRAVDLRAVVADKTGLTTAQMSDLSERGCRLYLSKAIPLRQYLMLKVYPNDGTTALQVGLARVKWTAPQVVGVQFLSLSSQNMVRLARLCGDTDQKGPVEGT